MKDQSPSITCIDRRAVRPGRACFGGASQCGPGRDHLGDYAAIGPVTPVGWYLKFTPDPAYSGQAQVRFRLFNATGASNVGTVTYALGYDAAKVAQDVDNLVHGFVPARQNMISSTIELPGLMERRRMAAAADPVSTHASPSADGLTLGFATSLAQMQAARDEADGIDSGADSPFNIWVDGAFLAHNREENGGQWGSFAMVSLGADYLLSDRALLGLSFHYDRTTAVPFARRTVRGGDLGELPPRPAEPMDERSIDFLTGFRISSSRSCAESPSSQARSPYERCPMMNLSGRSLTMRAQSARLKWQMLLTSLLVTQRLWLLDKPEGWCFSLCN